MLEARSAAPTRRHRCDQAALGQPARTFGYLERLPEPRLSRRFDHARRELLQARTDISVTEAAIRCGFTHLGRFAEFCRRSLSCVVG